MDAYAFLKPADQKDGYWGPVTSTIDWCELNYTHSHYVAEWWNTLSCVPPIVWSLYSATRAWRTGSPASVVLLPLWTAVVFAGSVAFHGSLLWETQLMDELPMLWQMSYAIYAIFNLGRFPGAPWLLAAWDVAIAVGYVAFPYPVGFQAFYFVMFWTQYLRTIVLLRRNPKGHPAREQLWFSYVGVSLCLLAFAIWNVDSQFCPGLRELRAWLVSNGAGSLGFLSEGHAWWHLLMGYGSYLVGVALVQAVLIVQRPGETWRCDADAWFPLYYRVDKKKE
ncbi:Alkaline ceramidase 3 [Vanrija albida]|uniref:Alkaline ceramidase 3 n=1 Tax=Vanrija albida TaxID=181172 RepID=A0ABR3Q2A1_9TREE